ncbi:MAG: hypothetical protein GF320_08925 [Armatimonadia bacterium]|nr:hypothetical protein [Armatimonadia bacterium]
MSRAKAILMALAIVVGLIGLASFVGCGQEEDPAEAMAAGPPPGSRAAEGPGATAAGDMGAPKAGGAEAGDGEADSAE